MGETRELGALDGAAVFEPVLEVGFEGGLGLRVGEHEVCGHFPEDDFFVEEDAAAAEVEFHLVAGGAGADHAFEIHAWFPGVAEAFAIDGEDVVAGFNAVLFGGGAGDDGENHDGKEHFAPGFAADDDGVLHLDAEECFGAAEEFGFGDLVKDAAEAEFDLGVVGFGEALADGFGEAAGGGNLPEFFLGGFPSGEVVVREVVDEAVDVGLGEFRGFRYFGSFRGFWRFVSAGGGKS